MSEQDDREAIELPSHGDLAYGALMDALAPEGGAEGAGAPAPGDDGAGAAAPDAGADAAGAGAGDAAATGAGDDSDGGRDAAAGQPAGAEGGQDRGADGAGSEGDDGAADGGSPEPAAERGEPDPQVAALAASIAPKLGQISNAIEQNVTKGFQAEAYKAVREEYTKYFDALEKHPRLLIGSEVPSVKGEGTERLRDSNDAKEWQEAVKSILVQEIQSRAQKRMGEASQFMETVHGSVDLFKNNADLIPGTPKFDRDLADAFAEMAKPYELRVDGKLQGYTIPVQPLIDSLRKQRAKKTPAAGSRQQSKAASKPPPEPPQAGVQSKAAASSQQEDFSVLFGTIGLPHLKI